MGKKKTSQDKPENPFKAVGMVAAFGNIFCQTLKEKNDWKLRMIKAGMGNGLILPDDWDTLSEEVKAKRLDAVIAETRK